MGCVLCIILYFIVLCILFVLCIVKPWLAPRGALLLGGAAAHASHRLLASSRSTTSRPIPHCSTETPIHRCDPTYSNPPTVTKPTCNRPPTRLDRPPPKFPKSSTKTRYFWLPGRFSPRRLQGLLTKNVRFVNAKKSFHTQLVKLECRLLSVT